MTWTRGTISGETVNHTDDGDIHITGKIDGGSHVTLVSNHGSIIIDGKVDGGSNVTLTAALVVRIGAAGTDDGEKKIDNYSTVQVRAGRDISVGHKIDDNSTVTMVSERGSITIGGKIDHDSRVTLTALGNIRIGEAGNDGGERKIDGNSIVTASAGGTIWLANKIDGGSLSGKHSVVDFKACRGIVIGDKIDGGSQVRLAVHTGTISIADKIGGGSTRVQYWPTGSITVAKGVVSSGSLDAFDWAGAMTWCSAGPAGHYWKNWPWTFGYVTTSRAYPRSLEEISKAVVDAGGGPIKAVGGGWSFSDASLPFRTQAEVDEASTLLAGATATEDLSHVLQGLGSTIDSPIDLQPEAVAGDLKVSTQFDQALLTQQVASGPNLPFLDNGSIIDIRGLASSLQSQLHTILSDTARAASEPTPNGPPPAHHYFHVQAGITMADLDVVLDHQWPRLAIQASGGSPGATLAGTLSTATHGGEFQWPLLVDRVRAIHLVGPGGEEWWIEGDTSIASQARLQSVYSRLDPAHFIAAGWTHGDLTAQDVLNAVIVSMGTMGVLYSIVLEVVPQYGIQQIVTTLQQGRGAPTPGWSQLVAKAGTSEAALRTGAAGANAAVLGYLLDGARNGTGIARAENVYCDLAINPFNRDCWITNRRVTPMLPVDSNSPAVGFQDYLGPVTASLGSRATDTVLDSKLVGRIFDFLGWATDVPSVNLSDDINDINQAAKLVSFITQYPDVLVSALATINVQAVANGVNAAAHPDRGQQFLGDMLTGFLNAIQGTVSGNSDHTDIAYKVGAIGWPDSGLPGRGIEIALPPDTAFTFLQSVLFDDVLTNVMVQANKPLIGYVSIRVCPPTSTLMGMQQFSPFSIMIEVVGYRSPEANAVMDAIQRKVLDAGLSTVDAMLHWGLENDQLTGNDLLRMPINRPLRFGSPLTRLDAFKQVRQVLRNGNPSAFDNRFITRLSL